MNFLIRAGTVSYYFQSLIKSPIGGVYNLITIYFAEVNCRWR